MSRADLLKAVWGYDFDPQTNIVEVYVAYLRKKVDHQAAHRLILTHRSCLTTAGKRNDPK